MREFLLIRHATVLTGGRIMGRSDWPATLPDAPAMGIELLKEAELRLCSPALRCRQTAQWLGGDWQENPLLWEQNFGDWEGMSYADLPELAEQSRADLAKHCPPNGESFLELCARFETALERMPNSGRIVILAHAGIIRAALGLALDLPETGLSFNVAPLSLTRLVQTSGGWAINGVGIKVFTP